MENLKIGKKISEYRRVHNLTIKEFSELTNLSSALLSQLERGMGNPSLSALQSIASALNVSLSSLFEEDVRKTIYNPDQKHVLYDVLTPSPINSTVELLLMNLSANSNTYGNYSTHIEEELAFILEGEVYIIFNDEEEFLLREGDTIRILPNREHKFRNSTDKDVKVLIIKSKQNY